jgi:hypothetical protein
MSFRQKQAIFGWSIPFEPFLKKTFGLWNRLICQGLWFIPVSMSVNLSERNVKVSGTRLSQNWTQALNSTDSNRSNTIAIMHKFQSCSACNPRENTKSGDLKSRLRFEESSICSDQIFSSEYQSKPIDITILFHH